MDQRAGSIKTLKYMLFATIGMFALSYAAVPIYNIFCKATGFGGTTRIATYHSEQVINKALVVNFDANVAPGLDWRFKPAQNKIKLKIGENAIVFYEAENITDHDIVGTAVYNVVPEKAGIYFNKVHCFCFEEQLLKPKQKVMMPVSFFIDPEIDNDKDLKDIKEITLSYSFFKVRNGKLKKGSEAKTWSNI